MRAFIVLFLMTSFLSAQKVVEKSLTNTAISGVQIDVANCFDLQIETVDSETIEIQAFIDGEYEKELVLSVKEDGAICQISTGFQLNFINPNDKLSAHKVVSIALRVKLPKHKNVSIFGTSCNVNAAGVYQKIKIALNDGNTVLNEVFGKAEVISQSGNIYASTSAAIITSKSKYGKVEEPKIPKGENLYNLSSVTGNILISKIE